MVVLLLLLLVSWELMLLWWVWHELIEVGWVPSGDAQEQSI